MADPEIRTREAVWRSTNYGGRVGHAPEPENFVKIVVVKINFCTELINALVVFMDILCFIFGGCDSGHGRRPGSATAYGMTLL